MSKPLRVGLVGTGRIANRHLSPYLEHPERVHLTAVCDVVGSAVQHYAKQARIDSTYTDFDEMLRDADIDAVDICTSHDQHAAQTVKAAKAGKHVLVEKAMAHTLQGCREMIEATERAKVTLMVAQHLRYSSDASAVKRFIEEGNLGQIQAVRNHKISGRNTRSDTGHWMRDGKQAGGGTLMVVSVHHLDLLRYYAGNVKRVMAVCRTLQPGNINGAEDLVAATLEFKNGAIGNIFVKNGSPAPEAQSYTIIGSRGTLHSTPPAATREKAINQFGTIMFSLKEEHTDTLHPRGRKRSPRSKFKPLATRASDQPTDDYFTNEILHFEECCRTGSEPISSGRDNIETIKIIMGIYKSSQTGKAIDLNTL